ncbi:hypothetical protein [Oleiagrimonas sp. C23AA]|uniref:hypothetical protein n=1 Tax=Oleiagrimonas sp. C23AA TaxID=2719047 RepID=UPI0014246A6B|nr:hypothetical protein [Oleiagrimonas sp. C23AA]NII11776.1 hypothetical protein [Oleiagrimonas sp. C23AA]
MAIARPHRSRSWLAGLMLGTLALAPNLYAKPPATLQERMSYAQFKQLGLDKLSDEQLKGLNQWLDTHGMSGPSVDDVQRQADDVGSGRREVRRHTINSTLVGTFSGWEDGTVFTLANGQKWKVQDTSAPIHMAGIDNPKVTVEPGFFGSWMFSVDGVRDTVHVVPAN